MSEPERRQLPQDWGWVELQEVCSINPRRPSLDYGITEPTTFVPMAAVDEIMGIIAAPEEKPFGEVTKGYTYFEEGDVLFSKITPCMQNGKHAVAQGLRHGFGFGTTEFHVLRPGPKLEAHWLHAFLRQPEILHRAEQSFTGTVGQQRVPSAFLEGLQIPLPPLPEQQRIARLLKTKLAAVERARQASEARLEAARALLESYLRDIFDGHEADSWPQEPVGDLVVSDIKTGISKPEDPTSTTYCLTLSSVRQGTLNLKEVKPVSLTPDQIAANTLTPDAFYVVRGNGNRSLVGRGGLAPAGSQTVVFPDLLFEIIPNDKRLIPEFLRWAWDSRAVRNQIEEKSMTAAGIYKINQRNLASTVVPVPTIRDQRRIADMLYARASKLRKLDRFLMAEHGGISRLTSSLLRQAFSGAL